MTIMDCPICATLNEENLRRAFRARTMYRHPRLEMVNGWHEELRPDGKIGVEAEFFCDACGQTTTVFVELKGEPDPADWWKAE